MALLLLAPPRTAQAALEERSRPDPRAILVRLRSAALRSGQVGLAGLDRTSELSTPWARALALPGIVVEAPFEDLLPADAAEPLARTYRIVIPPDVDFVQELAGLTSSPEVESAQPDSRYHLDWVEVGRVGEDSGLPARGTAGGTGNGPAAGSFLPDDPLFVDGSQWGLSNSGTGPFGGVAGADIGAPAGWGITTGSSSTILAIVDTGFDLHHPDLNRILVTGAPRLTRTFNSSIEGLGGTPDDSVGHGTLVAGIALALTNNGPLLDGRGVAGVCGGSGGDSVGCRVIAVKATPRSLTDALSSELARGIVYATTAGARAINLSFGSDDDNDTVRDAISYAQNRGVVVVCGAGNGQDERPQYPGYYAHYGDGVSVAALHSDGTLARFSSRGPQIDVAAPGDEIMSTYLTYENAFGSPRRNYEYSSGTSFAAPFVTGLVGLAVTLQPGLVDNEFQEMLRRTARDVGDPGRDNTFGWGVPDTRHLLEALRPPRGFERGSAHSQTWTLVSTDTVTLSKNRIVVAGCAVDGRYFAERWEVRTHVTLPPGRFLEAPEVIVRTHGSSGWGPGPLLEYDLGWGEAVPGSVTADGFDLRAYVFRIPGPPALCGPSTGVIDYVPVRPQDVIFGWSAFGRLDQAPVVALTTPAADGATWPVDGSDSLRWEASDTDTITAFQIAQSTDGGTTWSTLAQVPGTVRAYAYSAPCNAPGSALEVRIRAIDAHGGKSDQTDAFRSLTPDRVCFPGEDPVAPPQFALYPVAPNPSPAGAVFRLWLPDAGSSSSDAILIADARGRIVRKIPIDPALVGPAEVIWDGRDQAGKRTRPGVYFARAAARGHTADRRFVIVGRP